VCSFAGAHFAELRPDLSSSVSVFARLAAGAASPARVRLISCVLYCGCTVFRARAGCAVVIFRFSLSCAVLELVGSDCRCVSKSLVCAFAFRSAVGLVRQPLRCRVVRSPEPALRLFGFRLSALFGCLSGGSSCRSPGPLWSAFGGDLFRLTRVRLQSGRRTAWTGVTG
jgi:hypothetical protein